MSGGLLNFLLPLIADSNGFLTYPREVVGAAGTNQGTAAAITGGFVQVNGASGVNGVILPTSSIGRVRFILNNSASALNVYPASGGDINALGANTPIVVAARGVAIVCEVGSGIYFVK